MTNDSISIPLKLLDKTLPVPAYAYKGDAGMDLHAAESVTIEPLQRKAVSCGISIALPEGYAGFVMPRSGLAFKHGISIVNAPGLIDSNYRGEIKAILLNTDSQNAFCVNHGDRIAQLVVMPVPTVQFEQVDELSDTDRGEGGFGSSGV